MQLPRFGDVHIPAAQQWGDSPHRRFPCRHRHGGASPAAVGAHQQALPRHDVWTYLFGATAFGSHSHFLWYRWPFTIVLVCSFAVVKMFCINVAVTAIQRIVFRPKRKWSSSLSIELSSSSIPIRERSSLSALTPSARSAYLQVGDLDLLTRRSSLLLGSLVNFNLFCKKEHLFGYVTSFNVMPPASVGLPSITGEYDRVSWNIPRSALFMITINFFKSYQPTYAWSSYILYIHTHTWAYAHMPLSCFVHQWL